MAAEIVHDLFSTFNTKYEKLEKNVEAKYKQRMQDLRLWKEDTLSRLKHLKEQEKVQTKRLSDLIMRNSHQIHQPSTNHNLYGNINPLSGHLYMAQSRSQMIANQNSSLAQHQQRPQQPQSTP